MIKSPSSVAYISFLPRTLSVCWQVGGAAWRGACSHVSCVKAPRPSRHLFTPPGTRPARTSGLFWRSAEPDGAEMGVQAGGKGYIWAAGRQRVGQTLRELEGWGEGGGVLLWEELLSTKGSSVRLNEQRPRTIQWMLMTQGQLEPQGTQSVCVGVCDVSWCPTVE